MSAERARREHDDGAIGRHWISIHCDDCPRGREAACADCPVLFLLGREADDAILIDVQEERALRVLRDADLLDAVIARRAVPSADDSSTDPLTWQDPRTYPAVRRADVA